MAALSSRLQTQMLNWASLQCLEADCPVHLSQLTFSTWDCCMGKKGILIASI